MYVADTYNCRIRKVNPSGTITTVAGNGTCGYAGDNGPATSAELFYPRGLALDSGNLYIVDSDNHRVRKVNASGTITTVAGNGIGGYAGDNGPATSAELYYPRGVALDSAGNLYVADEVNHRVRKITASGTITTVAGNGTGGYGGDNGPATSAKLNYPRAVGFDSAGNLYIGDTSNCRIREVTGGTITTVAGNGTCGYSGDNGLATSAELYYPRGVALDAAGNLYISDTSNCRIREVTGGTITTVAGNGTCGYSGDNGPATSAELYDPRGVALDSAGNLYIADFGNNRIRKVAPPNVVTVDPPAQTRAPGQSATVVATLRNSTGNAVGGSVVTFTRSGINGSPPQQTAITDGSGHASYNYIGSTAGDDKVEVSATGTRTPAVAVIHWTAAVAGWPSDDCDAAGTNVVTGFVDGTYVKAKTAPGGVNATWVCAAGEAGGDHAGGKLILNASPPGASVASIDLDNASIAACGANSANIRVDSGTIAGQPWWVDFTPTPSGSTDSAWVCVRLTNSAGFRLRFAPGVSISFPSFNADPTSPHLPAYLENPPPDPTQPSALCQLAGGTRLANLTVGSTPVQLYDFPESATTAHLCVREGAAGAGKGVQLTVDGGALDTGLSTTNTLGPCPFEVFTSTSPSFGVYTSNPSTSPPASACVAVGSTALGVTANSPSFDSVVTIQQDAS